MCNSNIRKGTNFFLLLVLGIFLASGCAHGPLRTCSSPCPNPDEERDMFCGCYKPEKDNKRGNRRSLLAIIESSQPSDRLNCCLGSPEGFYIRNLTRSTVTASVSTKATDLDGKLETSTFSKKYTLSPHERTFITCARKSKINSDFCRIKYSPTIKNSYKHTNNDYSLFNSHIKQVFLSLAGGKNAYAVSRFNCKKECIEKPNSPVCEKSNFNNKNQNLHSKISELQKSIGNSPKNEIDKNEIMRLFEVDSDPCDRGNTEITTTNIKNEGSECSFDIAFNTGMKNKTRVAFKMPSVISGELKRLDSGLVNEIEFPEEATTPSLEFEDIGLHKEWGGLINRIFTHEDSIVISTETGCIKLTP